MFYKIFKSKIPQYIFKLITRKMSPYVTRNANADNVPFFNTKHNFYKKFFFQYSIIEWNDLDADLRNSENFGILKNKILKSIGPKLTAAISKGLD